MGTDQQSTPLSEEELAAFRAMVEDGESVWVGPIIAHEYAARLLATIDAARERPSALDVVTLARDLLAETDIWFKGGKYTFYDRSRFDAAREALRARLTEPDASLHSGEGRRK